MSGLAEDGSRVSLQQEGPEYPGASTFWPLQSVSRVCGRFKSTWKCSHVPIACLLFLSCSLASQKRGPRTIMCCKRGCLGCLHTGPDSRRRRYAVFIYGKTTALACCEVVASSRSTLPQPCFRVWRPSTRFEVATATPTNTQSVRQRHPTLIPDAPKPDRQITNILVQVCS